MRSFFTFGAGGRSALGSSVVSVAALTLALARRLPINRITSAKARIKSGAVGVAMVAGVKFDVGIFESFLFKCVRAV